MKRIFAVVLIIAVCVGCTGCSLEEHHQYTSVEDYNKFFQLTEIRFREDAYELFPKTLDGLQVNTFYSEWERGMIGSASVEFQLSVTYDKTAFEKEVERLKTCGNNKVVYDTNRFVFPAYVLMLGYMNTSYYALVDEENCQVHYLLLQIINVEDMNINKTFLPKGYGELGQVADAEFSVYEEGEAA